MTAEQLGTFNGLLALECAMRASAGDVRDNRAIVTEILGQIGAPDLAPAIAALGIAMRRRRPPQQPA